AKNKCQHSEQTIRDHLSKMQVSMINQGGNHFYLRSKKTKISQQLLQAISEKDLPDLFPKEQITNYL
ncbi:MAG: IS1634 family transposase, partial [Bacteroidota bacterium]